MGALSRGPELAEKKQKQAEADSTPLLVLHVYKSYFPDTHGGVEQAIRQISRATAAHGIRSSVFTLTHGNGPAKIEAPEAAVWRQPVTVEFASCPVSFKALFTFKKIAGSADVIHYHFPWPFADMLDILRPARTPAIMTYHSDIVRQRRLLWIYKPVMKRFLSRAKKIVATSPNHLAASPYLDEDDGRRWSSCARRKTRRPVTGSC